MRGNLSGCSEFQTLELIVEFYRQPDHEKILVEGRVKSFGDHYLVIVFAFFAGPEKTPAEEEGVFFIAFKDNSINVCAGKKKTARQNAGG